MWLKTWWQKFSLVLITISDNRINPLFRICQADLFTENGAAHHKGTKYKKPWASRSPFKDAEATSKAENRWIEPVAKRDQSFVLHCPTYSFVSGTHGNAGKQRTASLPQGRTVKFLLHSILVVSTC
jgi:hypothetical protein